MRHYSVERVGGTSPVEVKANEAIVGDCGTLGFLVWERLGHTRIERIVQAFAPGAWLEVRELKEADNG